MFELYSQIIFGINIVFHKQVDLLFIFRLEFFKTVYAAFV